MHDVKQISMFASIQWLQIGYGVAHTNIYFGSNQIQFQGPGATAEYIPHAGLDTSLTSTLLIRLIPSWTCSKSIIMWMAAAWIQQSPPNLSPVSPSQDCVYTIQPFILKCNLSVLSQVHQQMLWPTTTQMEMLLWLQSKQIIMTPEVSLMISHQKQRYSQPPGYSTIILCFSSSYIAVMWYALIFAKGRAKSCAPSEVCWYPTSMTPRTTKQLVHWCR